METDAGRPVEAGCVWDGGGSAGAAVTAVTEVTAAEEAGAFTRWEYGGLAAMTLAGAVLRMAFAWGRPRLGDEVGTLLNLRMSAGYLLTHFSGWLTMNYFILAEKGVAGLTGSEGWPLEVLPMMGGIAVIPLTAALARRLGGRPLALTAAALTAFNPYLVRFSPVLRAYAPLAALAVWTVERFFRWRERRTWSAGAAAATVALLTLLTHPNGIYVIFGLGALVAIEAFSTLRRTGPDMGALRAYLAGLATFLVPLAGAGWTTWLAYRGVAADVRTFTAQWSAAPPTGLQYVPEVFATYFGHGFPLFVPGGLLLAGVWSATQERKQLLPLVLLAGLSPVLVSLKGVSHFPWAYARFQIYCVPLLLILMAEGIRWLAARGPARVSASALAWAVTVGAVLAWIPPTGELFAGKRENAAYARTAAWLQTQRRPGDVIVIEGNASHLQLIPLLPQEEADAPVKAEDYIKAPAGPAAGGRVLFVAQGDPPLGLPEARRREDFGKLQVLIYDGPATAVCASLRADLARVADGRIDPALSDAYGLLALLDKRQPAAPDAPTAREWRLLARLCRTQTERFRSMPEQMRDHERPAAAAHVRRSEETETQN